MGNRASQLLMPPTSDTAPRKENRDLSRGMYLAASLGLYLPPLVGTTSMGIAGYYPFPQIYSIFISYTGVYVLAVSIGVFALTRHAIRYLSELPSSATQVQSDKMLPRMQGLLWKALSGVTLYSIFGALSANFSLVQLGVRGPYTLAEHLFTLLGLIPVVLITTFPIFFYMADTMGQYLARRGVMMIIAPLSAKMLVLGLFTPILVDTLLISYVANHTGRLDSTLLILWFGMLLIAAVGTRLAWQSMQQGMRPLRRYIETAGASRIIPAQLIPQSLDEMGLLTNKLRQRLEDESRLHEIIEATPDLIAIAEPNGRLVYMNAGGRRLLGLTPDFDVTTTHIPDFHSPETATRILQEVLPACARDSYWAGENAFRRRDGTIFIGSQVVMTHRNAAGKITSISTVTRDLSERKKMEQDLQMLNAELEVRVEERTVDLQRTNAKLKRSLEELQHAQAQLVQSEKMASLGGLVAGVAHEINTPVGIGVTAASHLDSKTRRILELYQTDKLTRSDMQDYLDTASQSSAMIVSNLKRAADLVRSFKQVAVDQSRSERRHFRLKDYLEEVLLSLRPQIGRAGGHQISLECPPGITLYSDPGAYSQIITNLVMNSLQHGFEGIEAGHIDIRVSEQPADLLLHYTDDGCGIAPEHLQHIFDPFYTTKRGSGGSGLGLHVIYNIITRSLGGHITCASIPGNGVAFDIRIPQAALRPVQETAVENIPA